MRQVKVKVNGKNYDVEVGDLSISPLSVTVDGVAYTVELEDGAPVSATPAAAVSAPSAPAAPVAVAAPAAPAAVAGSGDVVSPMPGIVLDICVKAGDSVSRGDQVCALEAMKMKSAIRASRDGVVASIEVSEGQRVAHGAVLVRFEK
jgi:glutaconyl-CoA/methylmalonyl-CoA decarboxylase subunit gamma